jgi:hypothetical protein
MKIAIKYGLGIAVSVFVSNVILLDIIGIESDFIFRYSGFAPIIFLGVGLFVSMKKTRVLVYNNEMNYAQGLYSGIVIGAFAALFLSVFNFMYYEFINTGFIERYINVNVLMMEKEKMTSKEIATNVETLKITFNPARQLTSTFIVISIISVVFSAIFSAILRTKETFTQIFKRQE